METLIKEQNITEAVINSLPGVFYLVDKNGQFFRWNKILEKISEYSSEEIAKMNVFDFFQGEYKNSVADGINAVLANGSTSLEATATFKNGKNVPFIFSGLLAIIDGKEYLAGLGIDITGLKRMENALKQSNERDRDVGSEGQIELLLKKLNRLL